MDTSINSTVDSNKSATSPRKWTDIECDFIKISAPIIAATDLLAEASHRTDTSLALREGTIYSISEQCCMGLLEIKGLFYELADLYTDLQK